ncbi:MAG: DUF3880 domain-containing protein [Lachnospiraceae bacterium]|nr:DUF3880 domain-containing protein [Lachnospiraceae bacterium]
MNILFYRYGSICEKDILKCFRESGHNCITIDDEIFDKNITGEDTLRLVDSKLSNGAYDCVFTINFYPSISDLCNIYHIRYICWTVDSPVLELFSDSIKNPWNRVFLFDRMQYEDIHHLNPDCIFHYPLAVDVGSKQQVIKDALVDGSAAKYGCDISFVGSLYTEKDPMAGILGITDYSKGFLDALSKAQSRVYGYYFAQDQLTDGVIRDFSTSVSDYYRMKADNHLTDRIVIGQYYMGNHITAVERESLISAIADRYPIDVYTRSRTDNIKNANCRGGCETLTQMPVIFHESRININPTSKAIRSGVPLRVFDIFACEGFLLSNYQSELCELFVPGEDFVYYESIEHALELVGYYLDHEDDRAEIAHNGYMKVKEQYSYMIRLNGLLLKAFES